MSDERVEPWRQHAIDWECYCATELKPCGYHQGYQDGRNEESDESDYQRAEVAARDATIEKLRAALAEWPDRLTMQWLNTDDQWCHVISKDPNARGTLGTRWLLTDEDRTELLAAAALLDVPDRSDDAGEVADDGE